MVRATAGKVFEELRQGVKSAPESLPTIAATPSGCAQWGLREGFSKERQEMGLAVLNREPGVWGSWTADSFAVGSWNSPDESGAATVSNRTPQPGHSLLSQQSQSISDHGAFFSVPDVTIGCLCLPCNENHVFVTGRSKAVVF